MADAVGTVGQPPRGVVTFLLADVRGQVGEGQKAADALHGAVSATVAEHRGFCTTGQRDGHLFVFARATDAVRCALDLQRAAHDADRTTAAGSPARLALHTAEAAPLPDGRYQGPAIRRCASLRDLAHSGQTLLSRSTFELVAEALPPGAAATPVGRYPLRGLARPEDVFELTHPDLPERPPPAGAIDRPPTNLPTPVSSFVGRGPELERVGQLLDRHRLVTLAGAGGCGKSRLARQAASARLARHPDGVWWVDLAPLGTPGLVGATVAGALLIREVIGRPILETVVERVGDQRALLVLDCCEHLVDEVAAAAEALLLGCPHLVVLGTSREPLGVPGEAVYRVPSMTVPARDQPLDRGSSCDAVRLFVERAREARAGFELDEASWPALVSICSRLDGLPLALELAAARLPLLSLDQIAEGLTTSFALIAGGRRTALPRQQTLRQSIAWSVDLLDDAELSVLLRTSVFAGGFDVDAATAVCAGGSVEPDDVVGLLARLVDKSLVHVDAAPDAYRYRLLETIRHVAEERLSATDDGPHARDRHLEHHLRLAEIAASELEGHAQLEWLHRLEQDHDNLRAASDWASARGDDDRELRLAAALWLFWTYRGHLSEARLRLERALTAAGNGAAARGRALLALADTTLLEGGFAALAEPLTDALALARASSDVRLEGRALMERGWSEQMTGAPSALQTFEEALATTRRAGDDLWQSFALSGLGYLHCFAGRTAAAREALLEALELGRRTGNRKAITMAAQWLGYVLTETGDFAGAEPVFADGCRAAEEIGDLLFWSGILVMRSRLEMLTGDLDAARTTVADAIEIARDGHNPLAVAVAAAGAAWVHAHAPVEDRAEEVVAEVGAAVEFARLMDLADLEALFRWIQGAADLAAGDVTAARAGWEEVASHARATGNPLFLGQASRSLALAAWLDAEPEVAERHAHEALGALRSAELWPTVVDTLEILAAVWAGMGGPARAARLLGAAEADRRRRGLVRSPALEHHLHVALETLRVDEVAQDLQAGSAMSLDAAVAYASRGRGRRERPASGWASLTPAEQEVVALVAEGLTNPQIGERLFISRRTVQAHLGRVFAKLGISSRAELAAEVARRARSTTGLQR